MVLQSYVFSQCIISRISYQHSNTQVRLGERQSDKKKFAMKFFKTLSNSDLENAKEEFRLSRKLGDHPHLVNVVDFEDMKYPLHEKDGSGHIDVPAVLVTDYCPNHSVIDFLMELVAKGKRLDEGCASMLIQQLLQALIHIHSKGAPIVT